MMTAMAMADRADAFCSEGEYHAGLLMAAAAVGAAEAGEREPEVMARALGVLANAHLCLGQLAKAAAHADRSIALHRQLEDQSGELAVALHLRALVHLESGELEPALALLDEALRIFEEAGDERLVDRNVARLTLGEVAVATENLERARLLYHAVLGDLSELEADSEEQAAAFNALLGKAFLGLGSCEARADNKHDAKDYIGRAIEFFDQAYGHGHPEMRAALEHAAALYRVLGDEDAADAIEEELLVADRMLQEAMAARRELQALETADE